MNSNQIREILSSDKFIQEYKGSVIAINELLDFNLQLKSRYFIVNNQTQDLSGEHWFAIFLPSDLSLPVEVFDSLGKPPSTYNPILLDFLKKQRLQYCYNSLRIQSKDSVACGLYCLYFISLRCLGNSYSSIMQNFHPFNYDLNEKTVTEYIKKIINLFKC